PAKLDAQIVREPPPGERAPRRLMQLPDHDLGARGLAERVVLAQKTKRCLVDRVAGIVLAKDEREGNAVTDACHELELLAEAPEPEEPDPVLTERSPALFEGELVLARVTDVAGEALQGLFPRWGIRVHALAVVGDPEDRDAVLSRAGDQD